MSGYVPQELLGQPTRILYASEQDFENAGRELYEKVKRSLVGSVESRWRRKNNTEFDVLISACALDPGDPMNIVFTVTDISELAKAQEQIHTLSRAIEQSPVSVMITDPQGNIEYVNPRFSQVTGYSAEEVLGKNPRILKSGTTPSEEYSRLWRTLRSGGEWHGQFKNKKKNGETFWELSSISPIRNSRGVVTHFLAVKEDITARRDALERIREQAALLDQTQDAILVVGLDHKIKYFNRSAEQFYFQFVDQLLGQPADALVFSGQPDRCAEACQITLEKGFWSGEIRYPSRTNRHRIIHSRWTVVRNLTGKPRDFLVINTDITERKRLEEQFLRAQRMESIGTLAAGVAHDLNNILAPILMAVSLLRPVVKKPEDEALLAMLADGVRRGAGVVQQLLVFGRGAEVQRLYLQPLTLLKEMAKVINQTFPKAIVLEQKSPKDLWPVQADATQIHQVLLNLCVNARDAMPQGGKLTISAKNVVLTEECATMNSEAKPGPYTMLAVADTGTGIPPEVVEKIFDPFFTTKEPGKGTGLGLSTVLGIVKSHNGFIQVVSQVGEGTRFEIYLPALPDQTVIAIAEQPKELPQGKGQFVLVVDDEEAVSKVARRILEKNGYRVLTVNNGAEGLVAYTQRQAEIQAVITDMVMPIMDGAALIRVLRGYAPNLCIIAMSGLAEQEAEAFKPANRANAFLCKPFTSDLLLATLQRSLETVAPIEIHPQ